MANEAKPVEVKILDKEYMIACPPAAELGLRNAAITLDRKMREIRSSGKVFGAEKIAVMAAINLIYELSESTQLSSETKKHMSDMNAKLDSILSTIG
ncbi:MAG: cell division protein ZapA [Hahellaceae bacterium]|nr:cell division protein ZapA [Hahellaceae bacterium]